MYSIDMFLLNKFQAVSDWFQEWFGINNFTLARICLGMIPILSATHKVSFMLMIGEVSFFLIFSFLFVCLILTMFNLVIKRMEQSCSENSTFGNIAVIHLFQARIFCVVFLIIHLTLFRFSFDPSKGEMYNFWLLIGDSASTIASLFWVLLVYFVSCTPKPHKPSKAKKLLKSFVESVEATVAGVFNPAPELATVCVTKNRRVAQRPILGKGSVNFYSRFILLLIYYRYEPKLFS